MTTLKSIPTEVQIIIASHLPTHDYFTLRRKAQREPAALPACLRKAILHNGSLRAQLERYESHSASDTARPILASGDQDLKERERIYWHHCYPISIVKGKHKDKKLKRPIIEHTSSHRPVLHGRFLAYIDVQRLFDPSRTCELAIVLRDLCKQKQIVFVNEDPALFAEVTFLSDTLVGFITNNSLGFVELAKVKNLEARKVSNCFHIERVARLRMRSVTACKNTVAVLRVENSCHGEISIFRCSEQTMTTLTVIPFTDRSAPSELLSNVHGLLLDEQSDQMRLWLFADIVGPEPTTGTNVLTVRGYRMNGSRFHASRVEHGVFTTPSTPGTLPMSMQVLPTGEKNQWKLHVWGWKGPYNLIVKLHNNIEVHTVRPCEGLWKGHGLSITNGLQAVPSSAGNDTKMLHGHDQILVNNSFMVVHSCCVDLNQPRRLRLQEYSFDKAHDNRVEEVF